MREKAWRKGGEGGGGGGLDAIQTCLVLTKYGVVSCDPGEMSLGLFKLATSQLLTASRKYSQYSQLRGTLILCEAFLRSEHVSPEVQRLNKFLSQNVIQCHHVHSVRVKPCNNQAGL